MKPFGSEMTSILSVSLVTVAVVLALPPESLTFRPSSGAAVSRPAAPRAAFVTLDAQTETDVLLAVRDTWRKGSREKGRVYADLLFAELPEPPNRPVLTVESRPQAAPLPDVKTGLSPFLPSQRAADPVRLPNGPRDEPLPFSREELLKID